jgi:hypothetical protein
MLGELLLDEFRHRHCEQLHDRKHITFRKHSTFMRLLLPPPPPHQFVVVVVVVVLLLQTRLHLCNH